MIVSLPRNTFGATTAKTNILFAQKLPPSHQPCREPTRLRVCRRLSELEALGIGREQISDAEWTSAVLADAADWRPEAQVSHSAHRDEETIRLGDICQMRTGFARYAGDREMFDQSAVDRTLLLRAKNFSPEGGLRLTSNLAYIRNKGAMFREDALVRSGEILFVRVGAGCYGRTALVPARLRAQADDWLHVLTPRAGVDGAGIAGWLNSIEGRTAIRRIAKGVGALSISKSSLAELRIPARVLACCEEKRFARSRCPADEV